MTQSYRDFKMSASCNDRKAWRQSLHAFFVELLSYSTKTLRVGCALARCVNAAKMQPRSARECR